MRFVVTGGAGFIGSAFVRLALSERWASEVVVWDALTYAGNLENLAPVEKHPGFRFEKLDVADPAGVSAASERTSAADAVFHFAAESHVDRSIESGAAFARTNLLGTQVLLDAARAAKVGRFVLVSTDEVYGALPLDSPRRFAEADPLAPTSPYAASKAGAELLALAAHRTHGQDVVLTRGSNTYGPYQFPEKFIPLFVTNALSQKPMPLYGDGLYVRDWLHVDDHARGIYAAFARGRAGEAYNLGGSCERANLDVAKAICAACGVSEQLITRVTDRPAHDRRYALDAAKAKRDLGFTPGAPLEARLGDLVAWYRANHPWWERIKAGAYRDYYARRYAGL
jgi:dTDP-glucose 4,6-dehydratase